MTPDPIHFAGSDTLSLRQLDELNGLSKGTSFRWFKACEAELSEGVDYFYLPADEFPELIDSLKASGQIYASTRHLLLLTRRGYECMRARSTR
ncbi:ORF6N domain-containing protein [Halopseudomonas litoralis]|uniref:ORF6N domain-containing protein n=1 Tax=Halopseudomonas litoralis TaxID=797277 RepID=A0A1H1RIB6_9GAMM|nr:ORF6N domain-containing protein [Halopseudomonas litoralis]SDS35537.1 ORF6N domain-containing protein [Halopseudomonas litoralis]